MLKKAMCFGVFDQLHPGHLFFLKQARKYGEYLIVAAARDRNVKKIKNKWPKQSEKIRLAEIRKIKIADKVILGQIRNKYNIIKKYRPDVICLGYDQQADIKELRKFYRGKIIRLKAYRAHIYKSSKL